MIPPIIINHFQRNIKLCISFSLIVYFVFPLQGQVEQLTPKLTKGNIYALIIGISNYKDDKIKDLKYSDKDALEFYKFLKSEAGGKVDSNNIRLLINENATTSNIYTAKKWLENKAKKDDLVYFYFSGHGDVDSSVFQLGFLLAYDSPHKSYLNNAVRIQDFNIMANTLSLTNGANVVLITDACRAGKLAGSDNLAKSTFFHRELKSISEKEIRMASCTEEQNSQEDAVWGGGRGVFSYFMEKGLKGLADTDDDGIVTLLELKVYLLTNVPREISKYNKEAQVPTFEGNEFTILAIVNDDVKEALIKEKDNPTSNTASLTNTARTIDFIPSVFDSYFMNLNQINIEEYFEFDNYHKKPIDVFINDAIEKKITIAKDTFSWPKTFTEINTELFKNKLKKNSEGYKEFKEQFASTIHNRIQKAINLYLNGDEAELEKRRYYNEFAKGYDEFIPMIDIAMSLIEKKDPLYHILEVKKHYFEGVIARIKIPYVQNSDSLLNIALKSQNKALALEPNATYVTNEIGVISFIKKDFASAETNFKKATQLSLGWAVPWSNLCLLYTEQNKLEEAEVAGLKAETLQNDLQLSKVSLGMVYEKKKNYLLAEEYLREAINLNQRHYLPFERLGHVYLNLTNYPLADSFFFEAEKRKKGLNFKGNPTHAAAVMAPLSFMITPPCKIDTNLILTYDFLAYFNWGVDEYLKKNYSATIRILQKAINADAYNPLAFYYMGKSYYDQGKWEEAEVMFKYAFTYFLDFDKLNQYAVNGAEQIRSKTPDKKVPYDLECLVHFFQSRKFYELDNYYFLGQIYENLHNYDEAEKIYDRIISDFDDEDNYKIAFQKRMTLLEKENRWYDAERLRLESYFYIDEEFCDDQLNGLYRRAIKANESNIEWSHKLGLFLYNLADETSWLPYYDTIIYFPKLGKEIFIDKESFNRNLFTQVYDLNENVSIDINLSQNIEDQPSPIELPGTGDTIYFDHNINNPRKDAIKYLLKTLEFYDNDKTKSADLNHKIGNVYEWSGSKRQAYPYYEKAVEKYPQNASSRIKAIDGAVYLFKNRNALNHLDFLDDNSKLDLNSRLLYAELLMNGKQYIKSSESITKMGTYHPYALVKGQHLKAKLNFLTNNYNEAINAYKNYLTVKEKDLDSYFKKTIVDTILSITLTDSTNSEPTNNDSIVITSQSKFPPNHLEHISFKDAEKYTAYTIARIYSLKGDIKSAKVWLQKSIDKGFSFTYLLDYDPEIIKMLNGKDWKKVITLKEAAHTYTDYTKLNQL